LQGRSVRQVTSADPRIAVVDDEVSVRTMLWRLSRLADYESPLLRAARKFLASLAASRSDCVILDAHMPGLSGFDVQPRLRAAQIHVPIVFITASDDLALDRIARAAKGVRLLRKPFSNEEVLEAIRIGLRSEPREAS
jgi:FixJ family two-component response regulator